MFFPKNCKNKGKSKQQFSHHKHNPVHHKLTKPILLNNVPKILNYNNSTIVEEKVIELPWNPL